MKRMLAGMKYRPGVFPVLDRSGSLRACLSLAIVVALALVLSACGKRGDPEPPDGKTDEYPRQYPDPSSL